MIESAIALNRFGLGARPDDALPQDPKAWLTRQLASFEPRPAAWASVPSRKAVIAELADYLSNGPAKERAAGMMQPADMSRQELVREANRFRRQAFDTMRDGYVAMNAARLNEALTTASPFAERLVHFWANHFAVSADKLPVVGLAGLLEYEAIRPHLTGRFSDMLVAVEQHPAMLVFLDQAQSIGPNSEAGRVLGRRQRGLNENLAREILELHTLGARTGYAQGDVAELALALTGWTVGGIARGPRARFTGGSDDGEFLFAAALHEPGERTIMGRRYAGEGEAQARAILTDLAANPATARHIASKLARHFAGDDPPPAMVERLTRTYLASGGDLPSLYRALIASPEAWASKPLKFKSPWEWSVSALRAVGERELGSPVATAMLKQLGQPTWQPGSPAGWEDTAANWAAPEALMLRVEAAQRLADRAGSSVDARALAEKVLPGSLGSATRTVIARAESPQEGLALLLVSPEFMRR